ncbi:hypothetical protein F5888DRAFT_1760242 [Russula emetica]|nr:hypothetical protein F5888DRAFT_1760242 [Russula emetica]
MLLLIKGWGSIMTCQGLLYLHATAAATHLTGDQTTLLISGKAYSITILVNRKERTRVEEPRKEVIGTTTAVLAAFDRQICVCMACFNRITVYESTFKDGI